MHDVTPARFEQTRACMDMLDSIGLPCSSLLVVPRYHDIPIESDPAFVKWLSERQERGDEIVLHGYRHVVEEKPRGWLPRLQCNLFSRMECEFLGLSADAFNSLIRKGLAVFRENGFQTSGFVPPSWLVDNRNLSLLPGHGIDYATRQHRFFNLTTGRIHYAPAVVLWGGKESSNRLSRFYNDLFLPLLSSLPLLRIALHPPDADMGALPWFEKVISRALKSHTPVTYSQFTDISS
jgi:hypothetical protein